MNSLHPVPGLRPSKGFTLMELMVVMTIIAVLISIMIPVASMVMKQMRIVQANRTATDLRTSIMMYHTEYKRFPSLPGVSGGEDATIDTSAAGGLISVLIPVPGNPLAEALNRHKVPLFNDRTARTQDRAGIYYDGVNAQLKDPWNNYYTVVMDTNYDNQIRVDSEAGPQVIFGAVSIHSPGPNRKLGGDGRRDDDIMTR